MDDPRYLRALDIDLLADVDEYDFGLVPAEYIAWRLDNLDDLAARIIAAAAQHLDPAAELAAVVAVLRGTTPDDRTDH